MNLKPSGFSSEWRLDPPQNQNPSFRLSRSDGRLSVRNGVLEVGIAVKNLRKSFGSFHAVDNVSFEIPNGQLIGLLGPSGSGKSTILRMIAGLEAPDSGSVELIGEDATHLPARHRGIGFVFQHYALFRHMNVRQNISFGLEIQKQPKDQIKERVNELLNLVQLAPHAERYPSQLSGGQRQRVALARALASRPKVLLLDEPFGALDAQVRDELRAWLRRLHDEIHVTTLFVTHDQQEAFEVADQVVILNKGKVEQIGPPQELYERPATPFVTEFLGAVNRVRLRDGLTLDLSASGDAIAYVRPHDFEVDRIGYSDGLGISTPVGWPAQVKRLIPLGGHVRLDVIMRDDNAELNIQLTRERFAQLALEPGDEVVISPKNVKTFRPPPPKTFVPDYTI